MSAAHQSGSESSASIPNADPTEPSLDATEWRSAEAAFLEHAAEIAAVPDAEMLPVNVDLLSALGIMASRAEELMAYKAQIQALAPSYDTSCFDKLGGYIRAARWAQVLVSTASRPPESIQKLLDANIAARARLVDDVEVLARRELVDPAYAVELRGINGHRNVAFDTLLLAGVLRKSWAKIKGKTAVTMAEIEEAERLSERLSTELERRDRQQDVRAEAGVTRQKAFTLAYGAYDQIDRAVTFVRWNEGDAAEIVPTIYTKRARKRVADETTVVPPVVVPIVGPAPSPPVPTSSTTRPLDEDPFGA